MMLNDGIEFHGRFHEFRRLLVPKFDCLALARTLKTTQCVQLTVSFDAKADALGR